MTRRACVMLLATGWLAISLPACSSFSGSLFKGTPKVKEPADADVKRAIEEQAWKESDQLLVPPPRPDNPDARDPSAAAPLGSPDQHAQDLPPGKRLPEFMGPPLTEVTMDLKAPVQPAVVKLDTTDPAACEQPPAKNPLVAALQCVLDKQPAAALQCLAPFDGTNRDISMRLLAAVALLADKSFDQLTPAEKSTLEAQLKDLEFALRNRDLVIDNLCLCERIDGYGQYQPVAAGHTFQAGTPDHCGDRLQVYVELSNITAEQRGNLWVTKLNGTISIFDEQGSRVSFYNYRPHESPLQTTVALSGCSRTYDFFVPVMPPGKFTLKMEITDETRLPHRVASKSIDFVVAPPAGQ